MATLALLQASTVAVSSDWRSGVSAKPDENRITVLRPGTDWRFLARVRTASNMLRAPKSAIGLRVGAPKEATVEGAPVVEDRAPVSVPLEKLLMVCSLLSSKTVKSLASRSRM